MQPIENINGLAILTQSAPNAQTCAISKAEITFPDAPILTLSLKFAPTNALSTNTIASLRGHPMWSVNSTGAAPVPPSAPSTVIKSTYFFVLSLSNETVNISSVSTN